MARKIPPKKAEILENMDFDFSKSPTIFRFLNDNSFVRGVMGPVGSGKSYACCSEIFRRAIMQSPSPKDGIKYSRFAIVRNSYPMLRTTTIKTWTDMLPEHIFGALHWTPPITHHIRLPSRDGAAGIDMEVLFLALDDPKDVRKLLSLELTGAWVNEARELPKAVVDGLTHRVGRYPAKSDGGPTWRGIILDTNPPDSDHWWHELAERKRPTGAFEWKFFRQPGGVIEAMPEEVPKEVPEAQGFIFSAGKWWKENPMAENITNLVVGYYAQLLGGKSLDWIRCYAEGRYTFVVEGKPVWPEYDDTFMTADLGPEKGIPITVGLDFGLTPAAVFAQKMPNGAWHILHELVTFDMGLERFCTALNREINSMYPGYSLDVHGDPAGSQRDQIYEVTAFDHLKTHGIHAKPTVSNEFKTRREAAAGPMGRLIGGKPGFLVNRTCSRLRKCLAGGYHFKRVAVAGHDRFKDSPNKNEHSHVGDALGYCLLGGGEHRRLTRNRQFVHKQQAKAVLDFDPFG